MSLWFRCAIHLKTRSVFCPLSPELFANESHPFLSVLAANDLGERDGVRGPTPRKLVQVMRC